MSNFAHDDSPFFFGAKNLLWNSASVMTARGPYVQAGDVITSVKIVAGAENLVNKSRAPPPAPPPPPPVEALADVEVV